MLDVAGERQTARLWKMGRTLVNSSSRDFEAVTTVVAIAQQQLEKRE